MPKLSWNPTCRYAELGSGPASERKKSWTLTGSNAKTEPGSPYLQICSAGSPEQYKVGPPGCQNSHLQDQEKTEVEE